MAKRKRANAAPEGDGADSVPATKKAKTPTDTAQSTTIPRESEDGRITIQIVSGSYDRVLHGIAAVVQPPSPASTSLKKTKGKPSDSNSNESKNTRTISFSDTFLFAAHTAAIRSLAVSPASSSSAIPGQPQKVILASGSSDERINLYHLSAHPPSQRAQDEQSLLSAAAPRPILENSRHRELGALLHHGGAVTRLAFPNRAKLLSASEDGTVAVTRTRDWAPLHSFKCPLPKAVGQGQGGTAGTAGTGAGGVNDFAIHPSMKIMLTVSRAERRLRLWNLVTGKKAKKLTFPGAALAEIGEAARHASGEGRRVVWGSSQGQDEFAVAFDRDVLVFGMDCLVRCRVMPDARIKVHEVCYLKVDDDKDANQDGDGDRSVLAVSTEDGRVLFFSTRSEDVVEAAKEEEAQVGKKGSRLPRAKLVAQLGGKPTGVTGRIKDFKMLPVETEDGKRAWYVVTASSDGRIRVWRLGPGDLSTAAVAATADGEATAAGRQVGQLLGTYETQNRITCVEAFVMIPRPDGAEESEFEFEDSDAGEDEDEDSDDDNDGEN